LVPVVQAWREGRRIWTPLLAATGPITCIGLGLLLYNALRFDNPLEFGTHYQLSSIRTAAMRYWSLHYLGFNSWVYFLGPARWGVHFPFVHDIRLPLLPRGCGNPEHPFGVLTNIPLVWLALAAPLAWPGRSADVRGLLRGFVAAVALLFATRALTLVPYFMACVRYEWEFCPLLVLLAVVGILGLERALAGWPAWRRAARWAWGLLLAFSLAFNLLASAIYHAEYHSELGSLLVERGQGDEAIAHFQKALVLQPDHAGAHHKLGIALVRKGEMDDAIRQLQEAIRLEPDDAEAHYNLGIALSMKGQTDEAIRQYREAIRLNPDDVRTHNNLGTTLAKQGRMDEAIRQFQEAVRLKPDDALAHNNLGMVFYQQGHIGEAIRQFQEALRLKPDYAQARKNLDAVLATKGGSPQPPGASTNR
jgi:Flp pilus assembly protein TadD